MILPSPFRPTQPVFSHSRHNLLQIASHPSPLGHSCMTNANHSTPRVPATPPNRPMPDLVCCYTHGASRPGMSRPQQELPRGWWLFPPLSSKSATVPGTLAILQHAYIFVRSFDSIRNGRVSFED